MRFRNLLAVLIGAVICFGFGASPHATLIEIEVEGTWNTVGSPDTTLNPFGIALGDTFTMVAIYDDAMLSNDHVRRNTLSGIKSSRKHHN